MQVTKEIYVGGEWIASTSEREIIVRSPSSEEPVGRVPDAGAEDVDAAVAAARRAFDDGPWPRMTPAERGKVMEALARELVARTDELARTLTTENGTPVMLVRPAQINNAMDVLNYYAELASTVQLEEVRDGKYSPVLVLNEGVGVVAAIIPWNVPLFLAMMKVAPAMVAGCTVVLKAAPETPLNTYLLAEAAHSAGVPAGVLNVLAAGPEGSERLVTHPGVDKVAFTGSTETGKRIAGLASAQLKRVTLELGGKSAAIVLDDTDLSVIMPRLVGVVMSLSGQFCTAMSRILVPRDRYDEAVQHFAVAVDKLKVGDPFDSTSFMGPLVSERQRNRVLGYIEIGKAEGATLVTGGGVPAGLDKGWYVQPTVFADVTRDMRIAQEEIFGPVATLLPYDDEDDAIAIANDSEFGLHGTVWTNDVEHGVRVARRIKTGTCSVNGLSMDPVAPFGGMKNSGLGRELGPEGLAAYLEPRTISVPVGTTLNALKE